MGGDQKNKIVRWCLNILLFSAILLLPWWVGLLLALFGLIYFKNFYEVLFFAVLADVLYGGHAGGYGYEITLGTFLIYLLSFPLKKRLILYRTDHV